MTVPMKKFIRRAQDILLRNSLTASLQRDRRREELLNQARYATAGCLTRHEHQVFSQNGEDGAIREILRRIGEPHRRFIEIGVGDGLENNTAFLLLQGWSGVWIEGSEKSCQSIRSTFAAELASGQLTLIQALVTAENINSLLAPWAGQPVDVFSLDIDLNTPHVWGALEAISPSLSIIEYNPIFPPDMAWTAEYQADAWWSGSSYYGGSLAAMTGIGNAKGAILVGCDLTGTNAYFVRHDLCGEHFLDPGSAMTHYEPARTYLFGRKPGHPRAWRN